MSETESVWRKGPGKGDRGESDRLAACAIQRAFGEQLEDGDGAGAGAGDVDGDGDGGIGELK